MIDVLSRLDYVVGRLADADVSAAVEPEKVNVPGVWVDFTGQITHALDGDGLVGVEVVLIVPANDRRTSLAALQTLLDAVVEELGVPDGDIRKQSTLLPDGPTGYPSLVLPYLVA